MHNVFDDECTETSSSEIDRITNILREVYFPVYVDETSDRTNETWLALLARYVDPETSQVNSVLLQMINVEASDCSAQKLFEFFRNALWRKKNSFKQHCRSFLRWYKCHGWSVQFILHQVESCKSQFDFMSVRMSLFGFGCIHSM